MRAEERQRIGRAGEEAAVRHLQTQGFNIVARNVRVGRWEIDIVAEQSGLYVFCEVRSKKLPAFYAPAETLDYKKRERMRRAAVGWMNAQKPPKRGTIRLDVAAVTFDEHDKAQLEYYENIEMR